MPSNRLQRAAKAALDRRGVDLVLRDYSLDHTSTDDHGDPTETRTERAVRGWLTQPRQPGATRTARGTEVEVSALLYLPVDLDPPVKTLAGTGEPQRPTEVYRASSPDETVLRCIVTFDEGNGLQRVEVTG